MRKILPLFFSSSLALLASGCLLTNELGLQPPGTLKGELLRNQVGETAVQGFSLSVSGYCNRFTSGSATCDNQLGDGKQKGSGIVLYLTPELAGIEPGAFYTTESADECLSNVFLYMLMIPNLKLQSSDSPTSTGSTTLNKPTGAVSESAYVSAFLAADACASVLREPGPLLHLSGGTIF